MRVVGVWTMALFALLGCPGRAPPEQQGQADAGGGEHHDDAGVDAGRIFVDAGPCELRDAGNSAGCTLDDAGPESCNPFFDELSAGFSAAVEANRDGCIFDEDCTFLDEVFSCFDPPLGIVGCSRPVLQARVCDAKAAMLETAEAVCAQCRPGLCFVTAGGCAPFRVVCQEGRCTAAP